MNNFFWSKIVEIYKQVFSVLKKNPTILFLFLWLGVFDALALIALFFAPSKPFSYVLAPIIRTFWGDRFLHYPDNFLLLPKLFSHAHFVISTVIGAFITGLVIKKIEADSNGQKLSTLSAASRIFKYYFSLVIAWLISYAIFAFTLKGILFVLPKSVLIQLTSGFVLGLIVQAFIAFLLPAIVILENGFFKTLLEGFRFGLKNIAVTIGLIFIPMIFAFLLSFIKLYTPLFVKMNPNIVLWVLAGGIFVSLIVDILITSSATLLYLKVRQERS